MLYKKPEIKSYSAGDLVEIIGPCQNQYTTATLNTISGSSGVNIDSWINSGGGSLPAQSYVSVGDSLANQGVRGLFGFDLSSIPTGSTIVSATLRVYQVSITNSPYADLGGAIRVDVVDFGSTIDAADYSSAALNSNIGNISTDTTIEWKTLDATSYVQSRLSSGNIQFRLYFPTETDLDAVMDRVSVSSADSSSNIPELVVTYR